MKDYSHYAVVEAVHKEMMTSFVDLIKILEPKVAASRLEAILNSSRSDVSFISIVGQFNSLSNSKTSADN